MTLDEIAEPLRSILDRSRWAPSGDNEQCWTFEVLGPDRVVVHGYDTRSWCVYDLDGAASQLGMGALLETLRIAASEHGLDAVQTRVADSTIERPRYEVRLVPHIGPKDPLADVIETRSVQRRALPTTPLDDRQRAALGASVGPAHEVVWRAGPASRRRMASLLFVSARIRLVIPEAYTVHRDAIAWRQSFSEDRVPERAVGADPLTAAVMRWVMQSWPRVRFFNRYLAGTWAPRLQLDVIPALRCAAHFVIVAGKAPRDIDDFVAAGRAMQRFWLTAASLGLQLQPEMTPLIFTRYVREGRDFTTLDDARRGAERLRRRMDSEFGNDAMARAVFMGRIGAGPAARYRSLRKPLERLLHPAAAPGA